MPDERAQVESYTYKNPRPAKWPEADYIVGNPPYIGGKDIRSVMGEGYAEALWSAHKDVAKSVDFVMYWWDMAADLVRTGKSRRFGFITTNSLPQTFSRRVVEKHLTAKQPLSIRFAIPDHPWVDAADGADVRVAMTVGGPGREQGTLCRVVADEKAAKGAGRDVALNESKGSIHANLRIGVDITATLPLEANDYICSPGVKLHGSGFIVTPEEAKKLGLGKTKGLKKHIRPYLNGRDLTGTSRGVMVIDLFGLTVEQVRENFPKVHQWVVERVKPQREAQAGRTKDADQYARDWWLFGKPRPVLREALSRLSRYIATVETAKHRVFVFLDQSILPDNMLVNIALDDAFHLGVLSSGAHVKWALAKGGNLEDRPRYNKTQCFDPFPFPDCSEKQKARISELSEQLDKHRKDRQAEHPDLTLTGMYNVLEKLRAGDELTEKDHGIHDKGLVATLKSIHDDLDAAVFEAYGWPKGLDDEEILERLVVLNHERAEEERKGNILWLRPEYQEAKAKKEIQEEMDVGVAPEAKKAAKRPWPKALPEQVEAVRAVLAEQSGPVTTNEIAKAFKGARKARVEEVLETLAALGRVRKPAIDLFGL